MTWLLHNYFLPTLNPSATSLLQDKSPLRPLLPILKQYKSIMKSTTKDASLKSHYKPALSSIMRDIERWLAEAKIAAHDAVTGLDWVEFTSEVSTQPKDSKEGWALERFCDGLLEKSSLIPLS